MQGENESVQREHLLGSDDGKSSYTLFRGHAGPVYSATFSPLGDFVLSSSSDSTSEVLVSSSVVSSSVRTLKLVLIRCYNFCVVVRLWSTKLNANLVSYKGHNYPVWDVQVRNLSWDCHLCC